MRFPIKAYNRETLEIMSGPARATDLEAIPHVLHDVQAFTTAATTVLTFFQAVQATVDLGNMESAGQLPEPQFFQPFYLGCDPLILPAVRAAAGTLPGAWDDMHRLVLTTRPTVRYEIAGKPYIKDIPLSFFHSSGGATGMGYGTSTTGFEVANNSVADGGWCVAGSFIVPPKQTMLARVTWSAVVALNVSPLNVRFWQAGVLFRRVL
jgi:hypothetical protein